MIADHGHSEQFGHLDTTELLRHLHHAIQTCNLLTEKLRDHDGASRKLTSQRRGRDGTLEHENDRREGGAQGTETRREARRRASPGPEAHFPLPLPSLTRNRTRSHGPLSDAWGRWRLVSRSGQNRAPWASRRKKSNSLGNSSCGENWKRIASAPVIHPLSELLFLRCVPLLSL